MRERIKCVSSIGANDIELVHHACLQYLILRYGGYGQWFYTYTFVKPSR